MRGSPWIGTKLIHLKGNENQPLSALECFINSGAIGDLRAEISVRTREDKDEDNLVGSWVQLQRGRQLQ